MAGGGGMSDQVRLWCENELLRRERDLLRAQLEKAKAALETIYDITAELQPNSGHLCLSDINNCFKVSRDALKDLTQKGPSDE
jgi:hypothetical protein